MKASLRSNFGKYLAKAIIWSGAVKRAVKKIQNGDYMLCFCFHAPSKEFFSECVGWLTKQGFHFISVYELEEIVNGQKPFPRKAVVLTIDDGWQSNLDNIVPVAVQNGVPVEIFVSTDVVEKGNGYWWSYIKEARRVGLSKESVEFFKTIDNEDRLRIIEETKRKIQLKREALTVDQVKEIAKTKYVTISSHTASHPILPRCSNEVSKYEIVHSKEKLEDWINQEVTHFAYPKGDYSNREISFLKRFGYTIAFSTEQTYITRERLKNPFNLPRLMMVESSTFEENICRMVGVWPLKPHKKMVVYP